MSDNNTQVQSNGTKSKAPSHYVYQVIERPNAKPFWRRIGSAWACTDGNGFNVQLESLPNEGKRITLRVPLKRTH
jgi:hypothetical protein